MSGFMNLTSKQKQKVRIAILFALSCVFLTSIVSADACEIATTFIKQGNITSTWGMRAVIAIVLSSIIAALFFMIGKGLGKAEIVNKAKTDVYQIGITALILILFGAFVGGICNINAKQFGLPKESLFDNARAYFEYAQSKAMTAYGKTASAIMFIAGMSSLYARPTITAPNLAGSITIGFVPFSGLNYALGALQFMMGFVLMQIAVAQAWIAVLDAIEASFLQLLLPVGVLLRCFMPTREFGGVLMSIAIGFFLFYPLMFSIAYLVLGAPSPDSLPSFETHHGTIIGAFATIGTTSLVPMAGIATTLTYILSFSDTASDEIIHSMSAIGDALLPVFILPAICWIIIAELVRNMSRALGEEVDIGSLARMI
jgi:hypothetical protein